MPIAESISDDAQLSIALDGRESIQGDEPEPGPRLSRNLLVISSIKARCDPEALLGRLPEVSAARDSKRRDVIAAFIAAGGGEGHATDHSVLLGAGKGVAEYAGPRLVLASTTSGGGGGGDLSPA